MSPFKRLWINIKAKFSQLVGRAEDPNALLDYSYEQQLRELQNLRGGIADLVTAKKRVQSRREKLNEDVVKLDKAARFAVKSGDEEKARVFLERKQFLQDELNSVDKEVTDLQGEQERMIKQEKDVQTQIERFRTKKEVSKAQYSAAKARVSAGEAAAGIASAGNEGGMALQNAMDKVDQMKARAEALDELQASGSFTDIAGGESDVDRQIAEMTSKAGVEEELEKLKAEVGAAPEAKPAEEGKAEPGV